MPIRGLLAEGKVWLAEFIMRVETRISDAYREIEVHICNHEMNRQVEEVAARIFRVVNDTITGVDKDGVRVLSTSEIIRFFAENQKVLAQDERGTYSIHQKLYELEELLDAGQFLRISKSEIVNLRKIRRLDMKLAGTIKVILCDGTCTYTSRRNIPRLKKALGIQ